VIAFFLGLPGFAGLGVIGGIDDRIIALLGIGFSLIRRGFLDVTGLFTGTLDHLSGLPRRKRNLRLIARRRPLWLLRGVLD
jgi:hypothetical protein